MRLDFAPHSSSSWDGQGTSGLIQSFRREPASCRRSTASMSIRPQTKPHQPVMLRFEEGVAPERGGPPLGPWQAWLPTPQAIEGTFPKPIIAQGLAAYQRGKVRSLNLRRVDLVATVADTETHTT